MKRVFCIGNGESRKGFDLEKLRQQIQLKILDGVLVKTDNKLHPSRDYKFLTDGLASDLFIT